MSLFIGNLSPHVQHRELEHTFRRFGRSNLELKEGYGFIIFEQLKDAERALRTLQGRTICGERPSITWARKHRPFQRFSTKVSSFRRTSGDRDHGPLDRGFRRRESPELEKVSEDAKFENRISGEEEVRRDDLRESEPRGDAIQDGTRGDEWMEQTAEELKGGEDELKEPYPLDNGRWGEPLSEGSLDHGFGEDRRDLEEDSHDKERQDLEGNEKNVGAMSHESPLGRNPVHSSRAYRNSEEPFRRGWNSVGKSQERCYNCGQVGHIMRYCRARANSNFSRDGFDSRRYQYRGLRGNGFRRLGGRFRGMEGFKRGQNKDNDVNYGRRILNRRPPMSDKKTYEQVDVSSRKKHRHRHHDSDSPRESPARKSRGHKRSDKRVISRSAHKRRRSSSSSRSRSRSHSGSFSSSLSHTRSLSPTSLSESLKSTSKSSSSQSKSRSSRSRSVSNSSRSRSCSRTSESGRSQSKSGSHSSKSRSRSVSRSRSPLQHSQSQNDLLSLSHSKSQGSGGSSQKPSPKPLKSHRLERNAFEGGAAQAVTSAVAGQSRNGGHMPETTELPNKKMRRLVEAGERQPAKRIKVDAEVDVVGVRGKHCQNVGEVKQEGFTSMTTSMDGSAYSSGKEIHETQKKKCVYGFSESGNTGGLKIGDRAHSEQFHCETKIRSNGGKFSPGHLEGDIENHIRKEDAITAKYMDDGAAKDQRDAKRQDFQNVASIRSSALLDYNKHEGIKHENISSIITEAQDLSFGIQLALMKEGGSRGAAQSGGSQDPVPFDAARLWPWEALLYRRLKRGPISTANYERRKVQNEEFHIVDKFVRSSSGWWEKAAE